MSISKIKENAKAALTGKWGKGACITLAYFAFFFVIGLVVGILGEDSLIGSLIDLASSIIQIPIVFGVSFAFIKLKRNEEVKAFDFLNLGFSNFGRAWKIGLRTALKMILPIILIIISVVLIAAGMASYIVSTSFGSNMAEFSILLVVALILYIVALIFTLVVSLLYSLTTYIAYDNPNMTALEVVNESKKMMKGNRGKLFILELSFIGWAILAVLTLGIGYFWLLPYMLVAEVCFYEYLLEKDKNNNSSNDNEEVIKEM